MLDPSYAAFMLDRATGTLPCGLRVAADLHIALSDDGRDVAEIWDIVRKELHAARPDGVAHAPEPETEAVAKILNCELGAQMWRRGLSGADIARTGVSGSHYMRMIPGKAVPEHGHSAQEATVVLEGVMLIRGKQYARGDIAIGAPGMRHRPAAGGSTPCTCFVARGKTPFWRFT